MAYRISKETNSPVVKVTTSGELVADEISRLIVDIEDVCRLNETQYVIVDQSRSSARMISGDEVLYIAQKTRNLNQVLFGGRLAIVLVSDLDYGLGRMWESYTSDKLTFESELFRSLANAEKWIDEVVHAVGQ